ncbi:hypothetical protein RFI_03714, partial [Reticulomyxa filosa]
EEICEYISHLRLRDSENENIYTYNEIRNNNSNNSNNSNNKMKDTMGWNGDELLSLDVDSLRDKMFAKIGLSRNNHQHIEKVEALLHHIMQLQEWNRIYFHSQSFLSATSVDNNAVAARVTLFYHTIYTYTYIGWETKTKKVNRIVK